MTKVVSINQRGSLTLPKEVRARLGLTKGGQLIVNVSKAGEVSLKAGAIFPIEIYTDERLGEFDEMNNAPLKGRTFSALKPKAKTK